MSLDIFFPSPGKAMNQSVSLRHSGLSKMTKGIGVTSLPSNGRTAKWPRSASNISQLNFICKFKKKTSHTPPVHLGLHIFCIQLRNVGLFFYILDVSKRINKVKNFMKYVISLGQSDHID